MKFLSWHQSTQRKKKKKRVNEFSEAPTLAVTQIPQAASRKLLKKAFVDFQNDVKVTDIELAAREGFESVEHAKKVHDSRYGN